MTAILEPSTTTKPADGEAATAPELAPAPESLVTIPAPAPVVAPAPVRQRAAWVPCPRDMRVYGAVMFALFTLSQIVVPAPDGPNPVRPQWASALDTVTTFGLLALLVGTIGGRRWSLWGGLAVGVPMLAINLSCPVVGHHVYAAWWFGQLATTVAMTALSVVLLRRARAS